MAEITGKMCGKYLTTDFSTPSFKPNPDGYLCQSVLVMENLEIEREFCLLISYDYESMSPVIVYSTKGGLSYDRIKKEYPETLKRIPVDVEKKLDIETLHKVARDLGIPGQISNLVFLIKNLLECFLQRDAHLVAVNPLVLTKD